MTIRILEGDCRDVLRTLPERFDCCITDPPYGETALGWDRVCDGWIDAVAGVLKPAASIWVFGSMRFLAQVFWQMRDAGFRYSQDIVWEKHNGSGLRNDRFRRVHEHAVMFYRGAWADVHHEPQFTNDARARVVRRQEKPAHWHGKSGSATYQSEDGGPRLQRSVMQVRSEHGRAVHPTQKPIDLLRPLVRYSCPPGGSIIDPFGGSASTALAASIEGRACTCIELDAGRAAVRGGDHGMKSKTAMARALNDEDLASTRQRLAKEIPAAQSWYDAVKREAARRKRLRQAEARRA